MSATSDPRAVALREEHVTVSRSARYFTLGHHQPPDEIWFVCHGYGQLAPRFLETFQVIAAERRLIVAPEGLSRFYLDTSPNRGAERRIGASWMTREERAAEIADYVRYLNTVYDRVLDTHHRDDVRVTALGFSQGVATACRWLADGHATAQHLILWAATLPPELPYEKGAALFGNATISFVIGDRDAAIDRATFEENESFLRANGFAVRKFGFAGGHRLDNDVLGELVGS